MNYLYYLLKVWEFLKNKWESPKTLITTIFLSIILFNFDFIKNINSKDLSIYKIYFQIITSILIIIFLIIFWLITTNIHKTKNDKIGIVIAITAEDDICKLRLEKDFIKKIENILAKNEIPIFQIIKLSEYHSKNFLKNHEKYFNKTNATFFMFGDICLRKQTTKNFYKLELNIIVRHKLIPKFVSSIFSKDIRKLIPEETLISEDNENVEFKSIVYDFSIDTKFLVGIACCLSGKIEKAFELHNSLYNELINLKKEIKNLEFINKLLPKYIIEESTILMIDSYKKKEIKKVNFYIEIINKIEPNNIDIILTKSILCFLIDRNIKKSLEELEKIKKYEIPIYYYNKAFLLLYSGNLFDSYTTYKKAFSSNVSSRIVNEIEEFFLETLESDKDKFQLHLGLGLVYYNDKEDYILAKKHFILFKEGSVKYNKYQNFNNIVDKLLKKIENKNLD